MYHWRGSDILQSCVHSQNSPIEVWEHSHAFPHLKPVVVSASQLGTVGLYFPTANMCSGPLSQECVGLGNYVSMDVKWIISHLFCHPS